VLKTLGLDDDLDSVEVVIEIEKAFDVDISDGEAEVIFNVGQLFDLLLRKVHSGDPNRKCACAMAFYRIRRALNDLRVDIGRSPSSDLSRLDRVYTKSFAKSLEERSGLRLPRPELGSVGWVGVALIVVGVLGPLAGLAAGLPLMFFSPPLLRLLLGAAGLLFVGGLIAGFALLWIDAGRLPKRCRSLGALAAKAASLSYGRLVKQGADARDNRIWKVMVEILSDVATVPADQIARETYFLASALKSGNTAA
jgi:hypothetical protein